MIHCDNMMLEEENHHGNEKTKDTVVVIEDGILKRLQRKFPKMEENNYGAILLNIMKKNSKLIGQVDTMMNIEDSYDSMTDRSIRCAIWFLKNNIEQNDVIAICTHNHFNQVIPALAALYIGAIFNPWWDYGLTIDVAKHFLVLTKPNVLFVNEECTPIAMEAIAELKYNVKVIVFGKLDGLESFDEIIEQQEATTVQNFQCEKLANPKHPALIVYTSGSTGMAKGVIHSHNALFGNIWDILELINCKTPLWYSTLCWISGILCSFSSIQSGAKRIIPGPFTEENVCRIVEEFKPDWLILGTSMANRLLKSGATSRFNLSSLKQINIGGAPLEGTTLAAFRQIFTNANVFQLYGTSEIGGVPVRQCENSKLKSIGIVSPHVELKVIEVETGRSLGPNEKGEICIRGPFTMIGYYNNPKATKESLDEQGWIHTHDLGYYEEDGSVYMIERLSGLIKWRGHHVAPSEIENLIQTLPGIMEVAVVPVPHSEDDEQPFAFVVKTSNSNVTEDLIHQVVNENLPDQMKLRGGVAFVNEIPHTASGKIEKTKLRSLVLTMYKK